MREMAGGRIIHIDHSVPNVETGQSTQVFSGGKEKGKPGIEVAIPRRPRRIQPLRKKSLQSVLFTQAPGSRFSSHRRLSGGFSSSRTAFAQRDRLYSSSLNFPAASESKACGIFFSDSKPVAVEFQKKDAHHKPRALVAIGEGMIAHNPCRTGGRHADDVCLRGIGQMLERQR